MTVGSQGSKEIHLTSEIPVFPFLNEKGSIFPLFERGSKDDFTGSDQLHTGYFYFFAESYFFFDIVSSYNHFLSLYLPIGACYVGFSIETDLNLCKMHNLES